MNETGKKIRLSKKRKAYKKQSKESKSKKREYIILKGGNGKVAKEIE